MAFTASFAGTAGTKLTALTPPFTLRNGTDDFEVDGSGATRRSVTGTAQTFYVGNTVTPARSISFGSGNQLAGAALLASGTGATFSCYFIRPQASPTSVRLWKITNGGAPVQLAVSSAVADCQGLNFSVSVSGGQPTLVVTRTSGGTTTTILTYTDTTSPFTTGEGGLFSYATGAMTAGTGWSNYSDDSASAAVTLTIDERLAGYPFECVAGPPAISFTGTKPSSVGALERQVETEDGTVVSAWSTQGMSAPTTTTWRWDNTTLPYRTDGKDYRLRVREAATPANVVVQQNTWMVGAVIPINDQSLDDIMATEGKPPRAGALSSVRANPHRVIDVPNKTVVGGGGLRITRLNAVGNYGSGYTVMADEIARWAAAGALPNIPICFVNIHQSGNPMDNWNNNVTPSGWAWTLQDFLDFMLAGVGRRISALLRPVVVWPNGNGAAITAMNGIISLFEARLTNQPSGYTFPVWVPGGPRATRTADAVLKVRDATIALGSQGGRFRRLCGPVIDMQLENSNQLHQATGDAATANSSATAHIQGNQRRGFRHGRGVAALMQEVLGLPITIQRFGPSWPTRQYTSAARTRARVTADRDVKIIDGSTTALPQFYVSTDAAAANPATASQATWTVCPATKTGARTFEFDHPTGGNWQGQAVYFGYCADSPYGSGDDTAVTPLLAKLVYDATDDGTGREMVAMTEGGVISDAGAAPTVLDIVATVQGGNTITTTITINPA